MENNTNENNVSNVRKVEGTINDICFASDSELTRENCWCAQCKEEVVLLLKQDIWTLQESLKTAVSDARNLRIESRSFVQTKQRELVDFLISLLAEEKIEPEVAVDVAEIFDVELTRTYKINGTWEMEVNVPLNWKIKDVENSLDIDMSVDGDGDVETTLFEIDCIDLME